MRKEVRSRVKTPQTLGLSASQIETRNSLSWGEHNKDRRNIDRVLQSGLPCEIECDWIEPGEAFKEKFGHKYWIPQHAKLEVVVNELSGDRAAVRRRKDSAGGSTRLQFRVARDFNAFSCM
jgi:hypothetical protein